MIYGDTGAFTPERHSFVFIFCADKTVTWNSSESGFVRGFVRHDLQEQGLALRFNNAQHSTGVVCPQEALRLITHSARQSQIVSDKINTANRYE